MPAVHQFSTDQQRCRTVNNIVTGHNRRQTDPKLITTYGGEVTYTYTIIDAIAAEIPQQAIEALRNNHNVLYVEIDHEVHALGE